MIESSRRDFLTTSAALLPAAREGDASKATRRPIASEQDLCGTWWFRTDPDAAGERSGWQNGKTQEGWREVQVPHTFQIEDGLTEYRGLTWYQRRFAVPGEWQNSWVRVEFEAAFHSARVWINGKAAGEHLRKGYTAFCLDVTPQLKFGAENVIAVSVDNAFNTHMLPRGRSSDWAHDGGIYRPVHLLVTPLLFIERAMVESKPNLETRETAVTATVWVRNAGRTSERAKVSVTIDDGESTARAMIVAPGETKEATLAVSLRNTMLWHFDSPHLYRLNAKATTAGSEQEYPIAFGVRTFEVREETFLLNGETVRLAGVERMAGSNPEFGMAEPAEWIEHDHRDLKELNCLFTRVHWPQDRRVLDWCDRNGVLLQSEVPTWGPETFKGMGAEPDADLMQNGLEQLREMVARDGHHPSIVSWGLCNEIGGQNPPAFAFAKNMLAEAKRLDPQRLCSYASHSLFHNQAKDVAALMDFVECNEYIGSWQKGGPEDLSRLLDEIHAAIPEKPIVISEYGYCACTADRPEGDGHRREILRTQNAVLRQKPFVAGAIFFCYNDYRTHVGDRGTAVMKQRVHGVVDLYGSRKPSFDDLRRESSPIADVRFATSPQSIAIDVRTREDLPAYTLRGYVLRALYFGEGEIPARRSAVPLPDLKPGGQAKVGLALSSPEEAERIQVDILNPRGFSVHTAEWRR